MDKYDILMGMYTDLFSDNLETIQELDNERRRVEYYREILDKVADLCIDISNDDEATRGEHILVFNILEIMKGND